MHRSVLATSVAISALVLGCGPLAEPSPAGRLGTAKSRIVNGQPDTTHDAVVYVDMGNASCSGTIIAACNGIGYVLTAAHCCAESIYQAILADDAYDANAQAFDAVDQLADPAYDGASDHDFCVFQIDTQGQQVPVIPAMTAQEDDLQVGDMVEFVGYGVTESSYDNTERRHVSDDISELTQGYIAYDQQPGGPCNGDSGGPSLSTIGGAEHVSGVTSQGDDYCVQYGESGRVSFVYDAFIAPYLGACAGPPDGSTSSTSTSASASSSTSGVGGGSSTSGHETTGAGASDGSTGTFGDGGGSFGNGGASSADTPRSGDGDASDDSGCACEAAGGPNPTPAGAAALLGVALLGVARRRRGAAA